MYCGKYLRRVCDYNGKVNHLHRRFQTASPAVYKRKLHSSNLTLEKASLGYDYGERKKKNEKKKCIPNRTFHGKLFIVLDVEQHLHDYIIDL